MFLSTCVEYMSLYLISVNSIPLFPFLFWRKPPSYLGKYNRNIIRRVYYIHPYYGHTIGILVQVVIIILLEKYPISRIRLFLPKKKKFYLKFLLMFFKIKVFKYNYDRVYQISLSPYVSICLVYVFKPHTHIISIFNFF